MVSSFISRSTNSGISPIIIELRSMITERWTDAYRCVVYVHTHYMVWGKGVDNSGNWNVATTENQDPVINRSINSKIL